jgi:serine/threonine-protein kinase HipA
LWVSAISQSPDRRTSQTENPLQVLRAIFSPFRYRRRKPRQSLADSAAARNWLNASEDPERWILQFSVRCAALRTKAYADLAQAVRKYCHTSATRADNNAELFSRMVYNVRVSNGDDHLRNHGFVCEPRLTGWRLSPLYHVLPRASHAAERFLHLGVGPQGRLATLDNALEAHAMFTLSRARACEMIFGIWRVVREWRVYFEGFGVTAAEIDRIAPAFRHIDEIASPALRRLPP